MRLTGDEIPRREPPRKGRQAKTAAFIVASLLLVALLDFRTDAAPVQHLYYLPIILAAIRFGRRGSLATAAAAIVLYHLANPALLRFHHESSDVLQIVLFVAVAVITTRLAEDAARMRVLAHTDDLTGLHNLRSFESRLADLLERAGERRAPLSLLVLDLDRLKAINDAYGHLAGAEAVRTVGVIVGECLPANGVACRYGGDEFVIALPDTDTDAAIVVAERLRRTVNEKAPTLAGHRLPAGTLSISVGINSRGITAAVDVARSGEEIFREADRALYQAKEAGRNKVRAVRAPTPAERPRPAVPDRGTPMPGATVETRE